MKWVVRHENKLDQNAIAELTKRAFAPMEYSDGDEQDMIDRLRKSGRLSLSLLVEHQGVLVGHVAFARMLTSNRPTDWYSLGPIAVEPHLQRRHIGTALIHAGLDQLRSIGALGCVLVGDPHYYLRFGFVVMPKFAPERQPATHFMVNAFQDSEPPSGFDFDTAFYQIS